MRETDPTASKPASFVRTCLAASDEKRTALEGAGWTRPQRHRSLRSVARLVQACREGDSLKRSGQIVDQGVVQGAKGQGFAIVATVVSLGFVVVFTGCGGAQTPASPTAGPNVAPLAPSRAGPMTPEWQQFAINVDYACSDAYNTTAPERLAADREAKRQGVPGYERDAVWWGYVAKQEQLQYRAIRALGEPPAKRALFHRWLANVAEREHLLVAGSQAAAARDSAKESRLASEIRSLGAEASPLARRFGLRVCGTKPPR